MCEIFISHIHEDERAAKAISSFLSDKLNGSITDRLKGRTTHKSSIRIFLSEDQFQIRLGDDWLEKISSALISAKVVIALFSKEALTRSWVHFEAGGAWFLEKKLIPVCLGDIHPETLPRPYSNKQGCNLHDNDAPYYLYQSVFNSLHPGGICQPPRSSDPGENSLNHALSRWKGSA
jgi:hypothetical protein